MLTRNKKMLIVGGGYADIPLILSAKKIGLYVITTGNKPKDLGHKYSDEYHFADFSDYEAIYNLAKKLSVDFICPSCNDFAALAASYAAEKLGIPGHDPFRTAEIIHHKDMFREFAESNRILCPQAKGFSNREEAIKKINEFKLPVIVKPVDLTGGKGISVINNLNEGPKAIEKAFEISKAKRIVIEEFIEGSKHGFSAFLINGKVKFYFCDNEYYYINKYMVSATSTPSIISSEIEQKLCKESEKIASILSLKDGIFHVQFILRGDEPFIIEICRRPPGDLYIKFVEYATNVDYPTWIVRAFAGMDCSQITNVKPNGYYVRHCIMTSKLGKVKDVMFDKSIENNIISSFEWWKKEDLVTDYMTHKLGIVFLKFDSMEDMLSKADKMPELIKAVVE